MAGIFSESLGGDNEFQRPKATIMQYLPLGDRWFLGLRGDVTCSFGDVPFYARPFIMMRGTPAMRYMGEHVAQAEAEVRWQFYKRYSVVGFVGTGVAWNDFEKRENKTSVTTFGTGFRYELARKYGLHAGIDVGFGPDNTAIYVQFGSAWMRP
jgi:hemolysin activation/secretion protein